MPSGNMIFTPSSTFADAAAFVFRCPEHVKNDITTVKPSKFAKVASPFRERRGSGRGEDGDGQDVEEPLLREKTSDFAKPTSKAMLASSLGLSTPVLAGLCYCVASGSMVLLNKHALASFGFTAPNCLLCFQCCLAVLLCKLCECFGWVTLQPLRLKLIKVWFPVNLIFVGMTGTSFYALKELGVGMVTVMKNLSNVLTAVCDVFIFGKSFPWPVWGSLFLMLGSAGSGALSDVRFTWKGYGWQLANCVFTSAYALYLRHVMDKVADHTSDGKRMDECSMVYYNNLLSIPPIMLLMWAFGELDTIMHQTALSNPTFLMVAAAGGIIGFAISFSGLWFLSQTSATIYSLVGALNKIPVAVLGITAFREPTNAKNMFSIIIGLLAGVLFSQAKSRAGNK